MNTTQQRIILAAVLSGATWTTAALTAGMDPEKLADVVEQARQGKCKVKLRFVSRLKKAGEQATEASLRQHRKGGIHA